MKRLELVLLLAACACLMPGQAAPGDDYRLALPDHKGQLKWSAQGFKIIENSAKPNGEEIGLRGRDTSGLTFLGFLFLASESAPMTSAACRDRAMTQEKKANPTLKILRTSEIPRPSRLPVALVTYTATNSDGSLAYRVRGFVATADLCGDLELYSHNPIGDGDAAMKKVFLSLELDPGYTPQFGDMALYAQVLLQWQEYEAAAPIFEKALAMVPSDGAPFQSAAVARRVMRDQAGMSYGISGDLRTARRIFEEGTVKDPDYPMNYYNLACADAGEKKLADAKIHLRQAFDRIANLNPGDAMPVPTEDSSFLPYKDDQEFWTFLEGLQARQ